MPTLQELPCRAMTPEDLPQVLALQHTCYQPDFHESMSSFAAKLNASPSSCWVISSPNAPLDAYLVCLPVQEHGYPVLNALAWQAPPHAQELYVHDMAVSPALRGQGAARRLLSLASTHARQASLSRLSLIAVQDSVTFWANLGFAVQPPSTPQLACKLASFGADAVLMSHALTDPIPLR